MKKTSLFLSIIIIISIFTGVLPASALTYEPDFDVAANAVYMVNTDTGQVMYEKNADLQLEPASLTKIMTAILTIENVEDMHAESTYLKMNLNEMIVGKNASTGGFWPNDEASIYDILNAMLIQSAAECSLMLADYVGDGSVNHFISMMNDRAIELGCTGTNFSNTHGLSDPNNYTTARDMAIIAKHAMTLPDFREIVARTSYTIDLLNKDNDITVYTTNYMISKGYPDYYYSPTQGIKTGTLNERYLATQAKYNGYTYLLILLDVPKYHPDGTTIMDDGGNQKRLEFLLAQDLFDWAFDSFDVRTIVEEGEDREEIHVKYSFDKDFVRLETGEEISILLHNGVELSSVQYVPELPEYLEAPIQAGQHVGNLKMILADEVIGVVPLLTTHAVEADDFLIWLDWLDNIMHAYWFKFLIVFCVLITITYIMLLIRLNRAKKRRGKYSSYRNGKDKNYYV